MSRFAHSLACFIAFGVVSLPALAQAQGLLVDVNPDHRVRLPRPIIVHPRHPRPRPTPPASYKIKELEVNVKLVDQVARVQVSQSFVNTGSRQMEVCFVFPLPYDGAIDRLTLLIDGKEYPAKLLAANVAREMYESIVRKNKDPALLEWIGTGMFKTSVFPVPPGAERKVTLRYSQLCRKNNGLTDFLFPLSTAKYTSHPVEKVQFRLTIESNVDIKNVYSPTHAIEIRRPDNRHATVTYRSENEVPTSDFRLLYDVGKGQVGASLISYRPDASEEGYFLLLASPEIKAPDAELPKKTVVFVVDRSGSMSGEKIEQARGALKFVLGNLREGDLFNIIAYDSDVERFRPELQRVDDESRKAALGFVEGIYAGGSTNIDGALIAALSQLRDSSRPNYVIFLTDGLPTAGTTNESHIVGHTKENNRVRARLFTFGVGYDVNSRLLDRLARANFGQSEYVRPDEDIEASVSKLYRRIGAPVMTDLAIEIDVEGLRPEQGEAVSRVYPKEIYDLFAGEQLVLVGRYKKPGAAKVTIRGTVGGASQSFDFSARLVKESDDETNSFVEKLWAVRRVGEIIDDLDLNGRNPELVEELVALATKHGILTRYTSFLADETSDVRDVATNARRARVSSERLLQQTAGRSAFGQRQAKAAYQRAMQAPASGIGGGAAFAFDVAGMNGQASVRNVQTVGRKTFFLKKGRWVDSAVTAEQEKNIQQIERYSREYFDLVARYGKDVSKYLAIDEPVLIELGGQAYQW